MFPLTFVVDICASQNYDEPILERHDDYAPQNNPPFRGKAISDFEGRYDDELTLRQNDIVDVLKDIDANWYSGKNVTSGREGMFPKSFVEALTETTQNEIPLSRTYRAMHKDVFDGNGNAAGKMQSSMQQQSTSPLSTPTPQSAKRNNNGHVPAAANEVRHIDISIFDTYNDVFFYVDLSKFSNI